MDNEVDINKLRFKYGILFAVGENPSVEWNARLIKHILKHLGGDVDNHKIPTLMWNELTTNRMFGIIEGANHVVSMPIKKDAKCLVFPEGVFGKFTKGAAVSFTMTGLNTWVIPHRVVPTQFLEDRWWSNRCCEWDNAGVYNEKLVMSRANLIDAIGHGFEDYMADINEEEHKYTWCCDYAYNPARIDAQHGNYITYFDLVHDGNVFSLKIRYQQVQYDRSSYGSPSKVDFYMPRYDNISEKDLDALNSFDDSPRVRMPKYARKANWVVAPVTILAMTSSYMTAHDIRQDTLLKFLEQIVPGGLKTISVYIYKYDNCIKSINSQTKKQKVMAAKTTSTTSIFDRMINKYLGQYKPTKIDGLAMTMDGNIALTSGEGEYTAIIDDHLEVYPEEAVFNQIPFYSIQRPIEQVKLNDHIFLTTGEGRKLAKVTGINKAKDGKVKSLTVTRFSGTKDEVAAITDKLTGLTTIEVVLNLFDSCQFPGMGDSQMNPLVMMALMKDDKGGSSVENILMMSMMSMMMGSNGFKFPGMGDGQMNPLVMMALMKDNKAGESGIAGLEKLLVMSMMMGNGNPFAQMAVPAATTRAPRKPAKKTDPALDPDPDPTQEPAGEGE